MPSAAAPSRAWRWSRRAWPACASSIRRSGVGPPRCRGRAGHRSRARRRVRRRPRPRSTCTACRWGSRTSSTSPACRRRRARRAFAHTLAQPRCHRRGAPAAAGAVIVGKAHTTQFAYRDPAPTRNPWNHEHTPGGSSSGSAAAVAIRHGAVQRSDRRRSARSCGRPRTAVWSASKGPHGLVPVDGIRAAGLVARPHRSVRPLGGRRRSRPRRHGGPRRSSRRPRRRRDWRSPGQLFDRADAGLRQHLDAVVKRLAGAGRAGQRGDAAARVRPRSTRPGRSSWNRRRPPITRTCSPSTPPTTGPASPP